MPGYSLIMPMPNEHSRPRFWSLSCSRSWDQDGVIPVEYTRIPPRIRSSTETRQSFTMQTSLHEHYSAHTEVWMQSNRALHPITIPISVWVPFCSHYQWRLVTPTRKALRSCPAAMHPRSSVLGAILRDLFTCSD